MGVPSISSWVWSDFESAQTTGWAHAMEAIRKAEVSFAKAALDVTHEAEDIADDGSQSHASHAIREDIWPLIAYLVSATTCLGLSAVYHCFGTAMSRDMHDLFARLDFAGITTLILGSGFAVIYYTFYCRPVLQQRYLTLFTMLGVPKMIACTTRWYAAPCREKLRVFNFLAFGFSGSFMVLHGMYLELAPFSSFSSASARLPQLWQPDLGVIGGAGDASGITSDIHSSARIVLPASVDLLETAAHEAQAEAWSLLARVLAMAAAYLSGTMFFVTHLPESRWPGRFDNCCASHQVWHVCVMVAAYILWTGLRDYAAWRIATPCHCCD
jgi:predicted membrane channel-forming protein YqfA (hemolysin III family)